MKTIILIMGLPGSGKTTLAKELVKALKADWLNADKVRKKFNDWDFSETGIVRQVKRMRELANRSKKKYVVADFVSPLNKQIKIFKPNYIIWMDTIKKSRYSYMNKIFQKPKKWHLKVTSKDCHLWKIPIIDKFKKYKWSNKTETAQMLGRFQPFHEGHKNLFFEILKRKSQILIMVKDVYKIGDNPFNFLQIKKKIMNDLLPFKNRFKVILAPNISNIYYGREVGYKIEKINLSRDIQKISGTKIRRTLRAERRLKSYK